MFYKGGACFVALLCVLCGAILVSADEYQPTVLRGGANDAIGSTGAWLGQPQLRLTSYGEAAAADCGCGPNNGCCPENGCGCCLGSCCACDPGLIAFVEWTNWKVRAKSLTFGYLGTQTQIGQQIVNQIDSLSIALPRRDGIRVGVGYRFPSCWDVLWTYTYYYTNDEAFIEAPANGVMTMNVMIPWQYFVVSLPVDTIEARTAFKYDVNDLEIGRRFILGDCANVRLFGGFRWAILRQETEFLLGSGELSKRSQVDGYGLRMGAEGRWQLGGSGISVFGRGAGSVLAGIFDTEEYLFDNYVYRQHATRALPVLEAAAGVAWSRNNLDVSAGYEMSTWFNMNGFTLTPVADNNILLDGFFVRLSYRY